MNKKDLTKLGLEDEDVIQKIIVLHGKDIEKRKQDAEAATAEIASLTEMLETATATIDEFKKLDIDAVTKKADEWKVKAETAREEADTRVSSIKFDYALEKALIAAKVKNPKTVMTLLNTEALELDKIGEIPGLKEQLVKIQEDNDFLFDNDDPDPPKIIDTTNIDDEVSNVIIDAAREAAGVLQKE